jgi:hypothetical protein
MLVELGHELWIGDAGRMRAMVVRKQKTDTRDAAHAVDLLVTNRFPRIWMPSVEERICGSWYGIGKSWWGCEARSRISSTP